MSYLIYVVYFLILIGVFSSIYLTYVERKVKKKNASKAICDISDKMSCSAVVSSKFSKTLGFSNSLAGVFFYSILFVIIVASFLNIAFILVLISVPMSLYLLYLLFFKMNKFCIVCFFIHIINFLILILLGIINFWG